MASAESASVAHLKLTSVAHQIETLFDGGTMTGLSDGQLLERFNSRRDAGGEAAFAALVTRHGPMVLAVCRQLLDDRHLAEDAFQATFLVLARKARSIKDCDRLSNWLYGVASRTARRAQVRLARQRKQEEIGTMTPAGSNALVAPTVAPAEEAIIAGEDARALHGEIERLPDRFRLPVVLCYLEGLTVHEAARQLRWSHGTVRSRMARAREKLRRGLMRRGLVLPPVALAALLDARSVSASISSSLCELTTQGALRFATGLTAANALSASTMALAQEVLRSMLIHKLRLVALSALFFGAVATSAGVAARSLSSTDETAKPTTNQQSQRAAQSQAQGKNPTPGSGRTLATGVARDPARQPVRDATAATQPTGARSLRFVVLDSDDKPISSARVHCGVWTDEKDFKHRQDYQTDASGAALVKLPKTFTIVRLFTSKPSFAPMFTHWEPNDLLSGQTIPDEYTIRLERGVSASGRILDENDIPVAGAKVQVSTKDDLRPTRSDPHTVYNSSLAKGADATITDAEGRWRIENVPNHPKAELTLLVTHPDHVSDEQWGETQTAGAITTAMLLKGTAALKLKAGTIMRGRVTGSAGEPIEGAMVVLGDDPYSASTPCEFLTDGDGRFQLPAMTPRQTAVTVVAPGWAPQYRSVNVKPGLPAQDFRMERGKPIRLRVVDAAGTEVPKAYVSIRGWMGRQALYNHDHPKVRDTKIPRRTDSNGVWEWTWAPEGPVELEVSAEGFAEQKLEVGGGAPEKTIALKTEHRVRGRVTDAVTGAPIAAFAVVPVDVFRKDWFVAETYNAEPGKDGHLDYLARRTDVPIRLRVEAMGYRAQDGPVFRLGDDGARTQDFRLQPSPPISGLIVDAAGRPVPKVLVALATPTQDASLWSDNTNRKTYTDASGRFAFPDPGEPWGILARSDAGFVLGEFPADRHDAGTLALGPYATIRGQFRDGGQPVQGATILLNIIRGGGSAQPKFDNEGTSGVTGPDGRFEFTGVPPVPLSLSVHLGPWKDAPFRSGPHVPLDLQPGQSVELDLGGAGAVVTGKVTLKGNVPADLDCNYSLSYLIRREPGITPPPDIAKLGFDVKRGWRDAWSDTREGLAYLSTLPYWFVKLAPDGGFRISGVPPGEYDLALRIYAKPSGCLIDPVARVVTHVTVTAADAARGRVEFPPISANVVPIPAVGDKPPLRFARADRREGSLAEFRGSYTLVHFWASWCGPCKQQMPALRRLGEQFAARGLSVLGLSVDEDLDAWRDAVERFEFAWPQGRLSNAAETGVSSVPAYWLIDPEGKIVSKAADPDELVEVLEQRLR